MAVVMNNFKRFIKAIPPPMWRLVVLNIMGDAFIAFYAFISAGIMQGFAYHLGFVDKNSIMPAFYFLTRSELLVASLLVASTLVQGLASYISTYVQLVMAETYTLESRKRLADSVFNQQGIYTKSSGEVVNILVEVIPKAGGYFSSLIKFISLTIQSLLIISFCFYIAFREAAIVLVAMSVFIPFMKYFNDKSRKAGKSLIQQMNYATNELMQSIRNIHFLKIIGKTIEQKEIVIGHCKQYFKEYCHYSLIYGFTNVVPSMYGMIIVVSLFYFSRFILGTPPLVIFTFYYVLMRFVPSASQAIGLTNGLSMNAPGFKYMMKLYEENELLLKEMKNKEYFLITQGKKKAASDFKPTSVEAINISYKYYGDRSNKPIFEDLSFKVDFASCLVIQGASGTGKSTLLYTLLGLYAPTKGRILWGNILLDELPFEKFREAIGYVGPEAFLKEGTIYENLCYGLSKTPKKEELIEAARKADCLDFVYESNHKWETMISENGVGLSAGQKQRIGFARAYLRNPKILVLDEATSNLDLETEKRIVENLKQVKHEMIILAASHRDKILEIADQRIFMGRE